MHTTNFKGRIRNSVYWSYHGRNDSRLDSSNGETGPTILTPTRTWRHVLVDDRYDRNICPTVASRLAQICQHRGNDVVHSVFRHRTRIYSVVDRC